MLSWVLGAAVLLSAAPSHSAAQPIRASAALEDENAPRPPDRASNAAISYWKAWDLIRTQEDRVAFEQAMVDRPALGKKLTKGQRDVLAKHRDYIEGVLGAAAMDDCDWGSRSDVGPWALLSHLGHARQSARTLACDARRCAEDGNPVGAAERIVGILRLARHVSRDGFLISTLVGNAIGGLGGIATEEIIKEGELNPVGARMILNELKESCQGDFYNAGASIDAERRLQIGWLRKKATGRNAGVKVSKEIRDNQDPKMSQSPTTLFIRGLSEQQIRSELDRADRYFDAVKVAWASAQATVALDELETQAWEGQWGLIVQGISGPMSNTRKAVNRTRAQFERIMGLLRATIDEQGADRPAPEKP